MREYRLSPKFVIDLRLVYLVFYTDGTHRIAALLAESDASKTYLLHTLPEGDEHVTPDGQKLQCCEFHRKDDPDLVPLRFVYELDEPELYAALHAALVHYTKAHPQLVYAIGDNSSELRVSGEGDEESRMKCNPTLRRLEDKIRELTGLFAFSRTGTFTLLAASNYVIERVRAVREFLQLFNEGQIERMEVVDYVEEQLDDYVDMERLLKVGAGTYSVIS